MLSNPLVLLVVGAFPLDLSQLSIIDALSVPLGVRAAEVAPDAICFLVLTAG